VHARPAVDRHQLDAGRIAVTDQAEQDHAVVGVAGQVRSDLGSDDREAAEG
jgi:hypothetical protein